MVHTALPQQRRQRWRQWCSPAVLRSAALCCALLPQPSAPQSSQINAGAGCLLAAEEALLHAPPHVPAGCAVPSMPQTCKESAPCVPRRSGIGIARCRCDEHHRQPGASESPKGARSRATAPEHGIAISTKAPFSLQLCTAVGEERRCPVETEALLLFAARSLDVCAASRARSSSARWGRGHGGCCVRCCEVRGMHTVRRFRLQL